MEPIQFRYDDAKKSLLAENYSEQEADLLIAKHLGQKSGFDVDGAISAGYAPNEIVMLQLRGGTPDDTSGYTMETAKGLSRGSVRLPGQLASGLHAHAVDVNTPEIEQPTEEQWAAAGVDPSRITFDESPESQSERIAPGINYIPRGESPVAGTPDPSTDVESIKGFSGVGRTVLNRMGALDDLPKEKDITKLYQYIRETAAGIPDPETMKSEYQSILVNQGEAAANEYQQALAQKFAEATPKPRMNNL